MAEHGGEYVWAFWKDEFVAAELSVPALEGDVAESVVGGERHVGTKLIP